MLTGSEIKNLLKSNITPGATLHVSKIHMIIKTNAVLTNEDWAPHTTTRPTKYPRWKHRVQGVLATFKKNGVILYSPSSNTYKF